MAAALTTTIEDGRSSGRSLERGYFYFGKPAIRSGPSTCSSSPR